MYSGNIGAKCLSGALRHNPLEGSGKFLEFQYSEMQSGAFWALKFCKCPDSILNKKC